MDYNIQQIFFRRYQAASLALAIFVVGIELSLYLYWDRLAASFEMPLSMVLDLKYLGRGAMLLNLLVTAAVLYAIIYLPKYLYFTIEKHKKIFWTLRIRWILAAIMLVLALPVAISRHRFSPLFIALATVLVTNLLARIFIKRSGFLQQLQTKKDNRWLGTLYALSDGLALYLLFQGYSPNIIFQVLIAGLAAHMAIQLNAILPMVIFLLSIGTVAPPILLYLILTSSSYGFTWAARRRSEKNTEQTIKELIAFTGKDRETVAELLATSTGKLASNWHVKNPEGREAVENWYRENSHYYIYDLAQFHLAYKHIVFSLDVMSLSRGRVLDYGAGIGDLSLALAERGANVTYFDVEGESKQYARWQSERRGLKLNFASTHQQIEQKSFDTIIVLDVLEHLFEPELVLDFLTKHLAEDGLLIASAYFGATNAHPMHFDHKLDVANWLQAHQLKDAKSLYLRFLGSEAMRRRPMFVYRKKADYQLRLDAQPIA